MWDKRIFERASTNTDKNDAAERKTDDVEERLSGGMLMKG